MPTTTSMPSWVHPRGGLATVGARLRQQPCRIAYLGASVTAQHDGYRRRLHEHLVASTGHAHRAIHAGIGGVGAITGVFLMDDLVLRHSPELCFIEFSTGDSANDTNVDRVAAAAEGMIRKLHGVGCPVVLLHCSRRGAEGAQRLAAVVRQWEVVADHYDVPSLHVHRLLEARLADDATLERRWFRDVVHTTEEGAEWLAASIMEGLAYLPENRSPSRLPPPLNLHHCASTRLVALQAAQAENPPACTHGTYRFVYPWIAVASGNGLSLRSEGDVMGLLVIVGSDAGIVEITTERGCETISAFDEWCHYDRLHALIWRTPGPLHQVDVRLTDLPVDHSICRRPLSPATTLPKRLRAIAWMVRDTADATA